MESGLSTLRHLTYVLLALVTVAVLSNFYVASELARNRDELASLRLLLQKQLMGTVLARAEELQNRMDALNQSATGIDARMQMAQQEMDTKLRKAQDEFVARMQTELPKIMDNYIRQRAPLLQREIRKAGIPLPRR